MSVTELAAPLQGEYACISLIQFAMPFRFGLNAFL